MSYTKTTPTKTTPTKTVPTKTGTKTTTKSVTTKTAVKTTTKTTPTKTVVKTVPTKTTTKTTPTKITPTKTVTTKTGPTKAIIAKSQYKTSTTVINDCSKSEHKRLMLLENQVICVVPFKGEEIYAYCEVKDGDTIGVKTYYGDRPIQFSIRIFGVDAPESSESQAKSELEMLAGKKVTEIVTPLIPKIARIRMIDVDKYCGRYVGDVYLPGKQCWLSSYLLNKRLAVEYYGKKKAPWEKKFLQNILDM